MIWLQLAILITLILIGWRLKDIGISLMGVVGVFIFVTFFGMSALL